MQIQQANLRNRLLNGLAPEVFSHIAVHLEPIALPLGLRIVEAGTPITSVLFPDSGLASVISSTTSGQEVEVGLYGREGMGSVAAVLGANETPHATVIQLPGAGHRLSVAALRQAMQASPELTAALLLYVQAFIVQVSQTAMANATYTIEQRLARWLLMCHDRTDGDDLPLTHEFLSIMLGVRRTGVTLATHVLEGEGMIRARRGRITITNRAKLEAAAQCGYGVAEAEYRSLVGAL